MKKNNTADFTQFELFDETVTVFEIVENAIKEQVQEHPKTENIKHKKNQLKMTIDISEIQCVGCYFVRWGGKKGKSRRCYKPDDFPPCKNHERNDKQNYIYEVIK